MALTVLFFGVGFFFFYDDPINKAKPFSAKKQSKPATSTFYSQAKASGYALVKSPEEVTIEKQPVKLANHARKAALTKASQAFLKASTLFEQVAINFKNNANTTHFETLGQSVQLANGFHQLSVDAQRLGWKLKVFAKMTSKEFLDQKERTSDDPIFWNKPSGSFFEPYKGRIVLRESVLHNPLNRFKANFHSLLSQKALNHYNETKLLPENELKTLQTIVVSLQTQVNDWAKNENRLIAYTE